MSLSSLLPTTALFLLNAGGGHGGGHHGPVYWSWEWLVSTNVINIVLVALVLVWVGRQLSLHKVFHKQQAKVASELAELYAQRDQAKAKLADMEKQVANLSSEIEGILSQAKQSANEMSAAILADAKTEAAAIAERSQQRMAQEEARLRRQLEETLLTQAIGQAKQALSAKSVSDKVAGVVSFAEQLAKRG